ncbi:hypothetical protein [Devosia sp.]|uniref:hypothetical protein n=1 Tax=Devosia sp. TaxID=1871048 RepID=UPI0025C63770|nr:hypothetical protein [Devosia sp.]
MTVIAAWTACTMLAALAVFQAALAAGAPLGHFAWGGQHRVLPRGLRIGSAIAIALYAAFAVIIAQRAGILAWVPDGVAAIGIWVIAAYSALGIPLNAISRSRPERFTMTPVVAVLLVLVLSVAMGW